MATLTKTEYMSKDSKVTFSPEQSFDNKKMRHYLDGKTSVLHCHHYATLFTQLAMDATHFQGPTLLVQSAEDSFQEPLIKYFKKHKIQEINDRIAIAEQYFTFMGLGVVHFECTLRTASVTMKHSHVDEGWIQKFGKRDSRVNFIGEGFIKAACAAIFDLPNSHDVHVNEEQSIVTGAKESKFNVIWK